MQPLKGKVALVAGATRGAGRGVARMLGEAGATVYCSGRSAVEALAADRKVRAKSGGLFSSWGQSREFGFTDIDGSRPDWGHTSRGQTGRRRAPALRGRLGAAPKRGGSAGVLGGYLMDR